MSHDDIYDAIERLRPISLWLSKTVREAFLKEFLSNSCDLTEQIIVFNIVFETLFMEMCRLHLSLEQALDVTERARTEIVRMLQILYATEPSNE
jgi:hypothetical protein